MTTPFAPPAPTILDVVGRWHRYLRGKVPGGLDELLDDFPGDRAGTTTGHAFDCTGLVIARDTSVLEVETSMAGKYVNGVDIIGANQNGRIVEFPPLSDPVTTSAGSPLALDTQAVS